MRHIPGWWGRHRRRHSRRRGRPPALPTASASAGRHGSIGPRPAPTHDPCRSHPSFPRFLRFGARQAPRVPCPMKNHPRSTTLAPSVRTGMRVNTEMSCIPRENVGFHARISTMQGATPSLPVGPRRITKHRRVALPKALCQVVGIEADGFVTTRRARNDRGVIMIRPCLTPTQRTVSRDCSRARPVSQVGQVAIPAALLEEVGLDKGSLVAFSVGSAAIRMFSADRVAVLPAPRRFL